MISFYWLVMFLFQGGFFGNPEPELLLRWYQVFLFNSLFLISMEAINNFEGRSFSAVFPRTRPFGYQETVFLIVLISGFLENFFF